MHKHTQHKPNMTELIDSAAYWVCYDDKIVQLDLPPVEIAYVNLMHTLIIVIAFSTHGGKE